MKNSIKYLFRSPFKSLLFFLLIVASTALLIFGVSLWNSTSKSLGEIEESFTTIATVRQKESSIDIFSQWDSATKSYSNFDTRVYDRIIPVDILNSFEADYIVSPEKRPYYGAHISDCQTSFDTSISSLESHFFIAEFSPVETCVPSEPVRVEITDVLYGDVHGSDEFWFCDHYNDKPKTLEAGKKYIAYLFSTANMHVGAKIGTEVECVPYGYPYSSQHGSSGRLIESPLNADENYVNNNLWEEVTAGFYQSERGKV